MTNSDFDAFVKRQQVSQKETELLDINKELEQWRGYLDALYKQIESYMKTYLDSGAAQIEYRDKVLNEEFSGSYIVKEMVLKIGRATVGFTPVGTMLIGSKGRVDVQGPSGTATLMLINKLATSARSLIRVTVGRANQPTSRSSLPEVRAPIEWVWKIATSPPEMKFVELTSEAFFNMILSVANG